MATFCIRVPDDLVRQSAGETWKQAVARAIVEQQMVLREAPPDDDLAES